jgi:hypothetical protein
MPVAIGLQPQYSVAGAERRPSLFDRQNKLPTLTRHGQKLLPYARRFQELNIELSSLLGKRTIAKMAKWRSVAARRPRRA